MLYLNLRGKGPQKRAQLKVVVKSVLVGVLTFVFVGSSVFWAPGEEAPIRPLSIEERETVFNTLEHLEAEFPKLSPNAKSFSEQFADDDVETFVELEFEGNFLVRREDETVFFSPKFFVADSSQQQRSVGALVTGYTPAAPREDHGAPNEVAVIVK